MGMETPPCLSTVVPTGFPGAATVRPVRIRFPPSDSPGISRYMQEAPGGVTGGSLQGAEKKLFQEVFGFQVVICGSAVPFRHSRKAVSLFQR